MTDTKAALDASASPSESSAPSHRLSSPKLRWALPVMLAIGVAAAAASSEVIYATRELFLIPPERLGMPPHPPEIEREMLLNSLANHAIGFGSLGVLVCGSLGLGLGWVYGSVRAACRALLVGGALGLLLGAGGGMAAFLMDEQLQAVEIDSLFKATLIHLPNWLLIGVAMAVTGAVALDGRAPRGQLLASALAAGVLAAMLYPLLGLIAFPAAASDRPVPINMGLRMLCFSLGGAALGICAARWLRLSSG